MYSLNKISKAISLIALTLGCFGLSSQARAVSGDDMVNRHIWQPLATLYNGATSATAKVAAPSQSRQLFFEDRVFYQRAIEEVYWRHRIWPKERPDRKPSLDAVMSPATIEQKVQDYLRSSESLEEEWQKPITPEQLQVEMERMAQHSKQPEVLRELFAALGNDPFVIAECLARPVLSERLQLAVESSREPLESWTGKEAQNQMPNVMAAATANYTLPAISDQPSDCIDDSWTATSTTDAPTARDSHTAVWTGAEMIVWGGITGANTGGRYSPSTDSWTATTITNAPTGRYRHTAVWTGSEMIVWGGLDNNGSIFLTTGGRYNPGTDSWTATSTTNAPSGRVFYTAVWTGSEMIVWGGVRNFQKLKTGGRYNPGTDSWTATSITNAPTKREEHTAVWTGSEMIVWGGNDDGMYFNTGGRYNPSTDSWTATTMTNPPAGRYSHTAVWTGSEMIIWGGYFDLNTGGRYNPSTDSWTATTMTNPPAGRYFHTAVWTGGEMIVWGGTDFEALLNTGGRYNPGTDSWTATSTTDAPTARDSHTAVWTGAEMIVWGGFDNSIDRVNTGGRYCAQAGSPEPTLVSAASRMTHGSAGDFDIDMPLTGPSGVEDRQRPPMGGNERHEFLAIFTFDTPVTSGDVSVTGGIGFVQFLFFSGNEIQVFLSGVSSVQVVTLTVSNVNGLGGSADVDFGFLVGDVNGDRIVDKADADQIVADKGQAVNGSNFRDDINLTGVIGGLDFNYVKAHKNQHL